MAFDPTDVRREFTAAGALRTRRRHTSLHLLSLESTDDHLP